MKTATLILIFCFWLSLFATITSAQKMDTQHPDRSPVSSPVPPSPTSSPIRSIPSSPLHFDSSPLKAPSSAGSEPPTPVKSQASSPFKAPSSIESQPPSPVFDESSPFKAASPARSEASSPICEILSSPFKGAPSSPLTAQDTLDLRQGATPPCTIPSPDFHLAFVEVNDGQKRIKLDTSKPQVLHSNFNQEESHCRELFREETVTTDDLTVSNSEVTNPCSSHSQGEGLNDQEFIASSEVDHHFTSSESSEDEEDTNSVSGEEANSSESSSEEEEFSSDDSDHHSESSEQEDNESDDGAGVFTSPKVYEGCDITEDKCVLNLMNLFVKSKLSKTQMGGVLKCMLPLLPPNSNLPKTQYSLFNYVKKVSPITSDEVKIHYYCSQCLFYLGQIEINCNLCSGTAHKFFQIPLANQIRNLFEQRGLADIIDEYNEERKNKVDDNYYDLLDGSAFKKAKLDGPYDLTLMGHTDGISVSDSSDTSLWPLEWVVAEISPRLRFKFVLISGIWVDDAKPYMNTLLKPFVEELKIIKEEGVQWVHPRTKQVHTTRVTVPSLCADAPARAQLQNILHHGGMHSCHICEQKMKKLPAEPVLPGQKPKPRRRVFTFEEGPPILRTAERMERQSKMARAGEKSEPVKGVKGPSIISEIPGCDRSTAVFPEYMHCILCVVKEFFSLWFEVPGPWKLSDHHRQMIDKFLKSIRVPDYITRIPRPTKKFHKWKANELRSFLIFFSIIILSKCMKPEYFQHWLLLVSAFSLLLQDCVSKDDVRKANILLKLFCRDFSKLYDHKHFTYYIHQLSHIALLVERHGPLQCNSAFWFEGFNGILAKFIHGTKNQGQELVNNLILALGVEVLEARCLLGQNSNKKNIELKNPIKGFTFTKSELEILSQLGKYKEPMKAYYRAVIKWEKYTCSKYKRQKRRNNYTICYLNSSGSKAYGEIIYFCESYVEKIALVRRFEVDHMRTFCHEATNFVLKHVIPVSPTDIIDVIDLHSILCKVVPVEDFVCLRPNTLEYNL